MNANERYAVWCEKVKDTELKRQLDAISGNDAEITERFYGDLAFGTAGLRGILGAGSARMNIYTVGKTTQGFAEFLRDTFTDPSVAIAFDSRIMSYEFSRLAASIFAANGVKVYLYENLQPTPVLSFTVRHFKCSGGVMVTASHNPSKYNGYKAYGGDGCQLSVDESAAVTARVERVDAFEGVKTADINSCIADGRIVMLGEEVPELFLDAVMKNAVDASVCGTSGLKIAYTPLHGTGKVPVLKLFERLGVDYVPVASQIEPDGNFPTCAYPNPEFREALAEGLKVAEAENCDILIATDPDADRLGTAVRDENGFKLITGNELGCLMMDYILARRKENGSLPADAVVVKSIVTTPMADDICADYGVEIRSVYTGFKYICGVASELDEQGRPDRFIMGFEESYGYCVGSHVRDKDAVVGTLLTCEMAAYYKKNGTTLLKRLEYLYKKYGCHTYRQQSFVFEGVSGMKKMADIMVYLRKHPVADALGSPLVRRTDFLDRVTVNADGSKENVNMAEPSDVLEYRFASGDKVVVRPSGTEPKLKLYLFVKRDTRESSDNAVEAFSAQMTSVIDKAGQK